MSRREAAAPGTMLLPFHVSSRSPDPLSEASPVRAQLELQVLPLSRDFLRGGKGETPMQR